ncbi:MAG: RHS repeat-associated core domain-containing protein [Gammaproteobacteria bacterium]|nr:RHS repeat-associated core domain-containing protein [Gammaproteobacteria bacterium]
MDLADGEGDANAVSYTGKKHDDTTGLTYFGARYYDPEVGRFMGMDAVGFRVDAPISFNRYAYANDNPYRYIDPDGNTSCESSACRIKEAKKVLTNNPLKGAKITKANPSVGQGAGCFKCRTGGAHAGVDLKADVGSAIEAAGN